MAIITYDGFENYSSFDAVKSYLNYTNTGTIQVINSTDANGVTPRNGGSCLKMTSSGSTFPRVYMKHPSNGQNVSGILGFAIYPTLPAGGSFGTFTPIGANIRGSASHSNPVVNFTIGINSNLNIEIRRPLGNVTSYSYYSDNPDSSSSSHYFDAIYKDYGCGKNGCLKSYLSTFLTGALIGTSTSVLTLNQWNYIEIKYVLRGRTDGSSWLNSPAALTEVKINRNKNDAILDMNSSQFNAGFVWNNSSVGYIPSNSYNSFNCGKSGCYYRNGDWYTRGFCFGIISSDISRVWNTYIDDVYWLDLSGSTDNSYLGRVTCKKSNYDTVDSYTFSDPSSGSTALSRVSETFSGATSMTSVAAGNQFSQNMNLRASGLSSETKDPINVRQYVLGYKLDTNSTLALSSSLSGSESSTSKVVFGTDRTNGYLQYRDYTNAPDGAEWTNQKISNTIFKHTITTVN